MITKMKSREYYLIQLKEKLKHVEVRFGIQSAFLYGSVARDDFNEKSDLDLLISFSSTPSLFIIAELQEYLTCVMDIHVDISVYNYRNSAFMESVQEDLIKIDI